LSVLTTKGVDHARTQAIHEHAHYALRDLLTLIPTSPATLFPILEEYFPHKRRDVAYLHYYLRALLNLSEYCPVLRERILNLIISHLIQIDVRLARSLRLPTSSSWKCLPWQVEIDLDQMQDDDDDDDEQFQLDEEIASATRQQPDMAHKMDSMMEIMFQYLNFKEDSSDEIFGILIRIFGEITPLLCDGACESYLIPLADATILPAHKSKYTQFLLFYMCRLKPSYTDHFLDHVLSRLVDGRDKLIRLICAAYIGSFIARAKYIQLDTIRRCISVLVQYAPLAVLLNLTDCLLACLPDLLLFALSMLRSQMAAQVHSSSRCLPT
jgi:RNA polymerase I-specific transcription initiation factor RRN3